MLEISPYLKELQMYSYPFFGTDHLAETQEDFIKITQRDQLNIERTQRNFEKLVSEKIYLENSWNFFVSKLKGFDGFLKVTDRTAGAYTYSFKVEIVLPDNLGIGVCVSQIGKLFGVYFTSQKTISLIPLKEYTHSIEGFSKESINPFISYFPYSEIQIECANELMEFSKELFPDFELFNNLFASIRIENMVIEGKKIYKSDLFQVLFASNLVVI